MSIDRRLTALVIAGLLAGLYGAAPLAATGATKVADAAMRGDVSAARALLKQGADGNEPQGDGMTALHWAAEHGDAELATLLLKSGANPGAGTRIGRHTPLHIAAKGGHAAVVRLLVDAKADVNAATTTGATPLHFAAASGSGDAIVALLDRGAEVNAREPEWGQTPLMFAAAGGRTEAVKALIARGADLRATGKVVDISARNRDDGIESRERNARVAAIQKELAAKAAAAGSRGPAGPMTARPARNDDNGGEPEPLGYADLVGAHGGLTALLLAAREGLTETVLALLDGGADINQLSAADHTSPLLMAAINGHFDLAMELLKHGADVGVASDAGATPLYGVLNMQWAPKSRHPQPADYMQQQVGYLELVETLLKAGADPDARLTKSLWYTTYNRDLLGVDRTGATPFWLAAYTLDLPAMRLLLKYGADPKIPTDHGDTALTAAAGIGWVEGVTYENSAKKNVEAVKMLLDLGLDPNAANKDGRTPLMGAAIKGRNEVVQLLVDRGAKLDTRDHGSRDTEDVGSKLAGHTWQALDYADGLVRVGVQSAIARPETAALIRKLMTEHGLPVPPPNRIVDSICIVEICKERVSDK